MEPVFRPPPAVAAPWKYFFGLLRPEMPLGSGFNPLRWSSRCLGNGSTPRCGLRDALETVPRLAAGCRRPLEVIPTLATRCAIPEKAAKRSKVFIRRFGSSSTPISRLRHASRGIFDGAAASLRTDVSSSCKCNHSQCIKQTVAFNEELGIRS